MIRRTKLLQTKLTEEENEAFNRLVNKAGETRSRVVRKLIREAINHQLDLLTDEQSLVKIAIRQLIGMANNLNQITAAMHAGVTHRTVDETYLNQLIQHINVVRNEFQNALMKTKRCWVKMP